MVQWREIRPRNASELFDSSSSLGHLAFEPGGSRVTTRDLWMNICRCVLPPRSRQHVETNHNCSGCARPESQMRAVTHRARAARSSHGTSRFHTRHTLVSMLTSLRDNNDDVSRHLESDLESARSAARDHEAHVAVVLADHRDPYSVLVVIREAVRLPYATRRRSIAHLVDRAHAVEVAVAVHVRVPDGRGAFPLLLHRQTRRRWRAHTGQAVEKQAARGGGAHVWSRSTRFCTTPLPFVMRQDWLLAAPECRVQSAECRVQGAECRVQSAECRAQSAARPFLFLAVKRRGVLLDICDADALMPSPHLRLLDRETPQPRRVGTVARRRHARLVAVAHVELKVGEAGRAVPLKVEARALVLVARRNTHP